MQPGFVVTNNSKEVKPGSVFVAIVGANVDGHSYINKAIEAGAIYIVAEKYPEELGIAGAKLLSQYHDDAPTIATFEIGCPDGRLVVWDVVKNSRIAYARWAQQANPGQPEHLVAVTGTNGKTSTVWFYQQILALLGYGSACMGTLGVISSVPINDLPHGGVLNTPDSPVLHKALENMANSGVEYAAMEASSHGLHQGRMSAVLLEAAAFTNFTQDHLDYHGTMDEYLAAKAILFDQLLPSGKFAVLNKDIAEFEKLRELCSSRRHKIITYGEEADITCHKGEGTSVTLKVFDNKYVTSFNVVGDFQRYNLMAAIGLLVASDIDVSEVARVIPQLHAPTGRMEWVVNHNGADVFVDYAHTPDALQRTLIALRSNTNGRVHLLFGCGGDRDKKKRPLMGEIAKGYADIVIVTDDNPRFEDPDIIRKEITQACPGARSIAGRDLAIMSALDGLAPGDSLLIAGKGHEDYQIIGAESTQFSDRNQVLIYVGGKV